MAFLSIGAVVYQVQTQGAAENARAYAGEKVRSFNNALRSTRVTPKRQWAFTLGPMTRAAYNTLVAATLNDAALNCSGDALDGAAVSCMVDVTGTFAPDGVGFLMIAAVTLDEV